MILVNVRSHGLQRMAKPRPFFVIPFQSYRTDCNQRNELKPSWSGTPGVSFVTDLTGVPPPPAPVLSGKSSNRLYIATNIVLKLRLSETSVLKKTHSVTAA
ncbi:hypothetical protein ElyMa_000280900 [Elysia marginata]|uniref:Uncharacterized protein n=1 Tax=Elysia marginata TaxID=1093978 RepID=A0AAV4F6V4_9GAST|nr:hypothetical protein ElyMa_000280900 [Elysia marginata]